MIKIGILDDSIDAINELECYIRKFLDEKELSFSIDKYNQGFNLLDNIKNKYQIIFLDIDMPAINGLDVARKIREVDTSVLIVFVTNMAGCAINGYEVAAIDFLVKPIKPQQLNFCLSRCLDKLENTNYKKITIKAGDKYVVIRDDKLIYVEVRLHSLIYHTLDGEYETYGTLKELENTLDNNKFARCNNCYLVNLNYVESINGDNCNLKNVTLPISRNKKKTFVEKFMKNI